MTTELFDRLEREFAAAADMVPPRREPPAALIASARHRRRRHLATRAALAMSAVGALVVAVSLVTDLDRSDRVASTSPSVEMPVARDVAATLDADPALALSRLYAPTVVATGDGFVAWGGVLADDATTTPDQISVVAPAAPAYANSGIGASFRAGRWSTLPPAPIPPVVGAAGTWTGTEVVFAGGATTTTGMGSTGVAAYSATGGWRVLTPLPAPRRDAQAVVVKDLIVVAGGTSAQGAYRPDVYVGTGSGPWAELVLTHPIHGLLTVGDDRVVAYGFAPDDTGAVLFTEIDPAVATADRLPSLVADAGIEEFSIGADADAVYAAVQGEGSVGIFRLDRGADAWTHVRAVESDDHTLGSMRMAATATGSLVVSGDDVSSVGPRGVFTFEASGDVTAVPVAPRCSGSSSVAAGAGSALFWIDSRCTEGAGVFVVDVT